MPAVEQGAPIDNEPMQEHIHVISGGETLADNSLPARKAYPCQAIHVDSGAHVTPYEESITFTHANKENVLMPHDDSLVILAVIAKHSIDHILMDSDSSINLIYWNCFE